MGVMAMTLSMNAVVVRAFTARETVGQMVTVSSVAWKITAVSCLLLCVASQLGLLLWVGCQGGAECVVCGYLADLLLDLLLFDAHFHCVI